MVVGRAYRVPEDKIAPLVKTRIADKIGAQAWDCYHYPNDFSSSAGNPGPKLAIDSNMRDLARFGYLWLRQGQWNGWQIIPKSYVKLATQNHVAQLKRHYGLCWFVNDGSVVLPNAPEDAYFHIGNGKDNRRTVLVVIPSLDLVTVVGTHASKYNITDGYKSEPVQHVNEWIGKIIESIQGAPVSSEKVAAKIRF
jgi:CubicO group peptidase (beta-lactamase class C family)